MIKSCTLRRRITFKDHTVIAGDAFQTLGGVAVSGTLKPLFPLPALATWHKPTALKSAHQIRALEPTRLAVGHGRVLSNPLHEMDHAIAVMEHELEKQSLHAEQSES